LDTIIIIILHHNCNLFLITDNATYLGVCVTLIKHHVWHLEVKVAAVMTVIRVTRVEFM